MIKKKLYQYIYIYISRPPPRETDRQIYWLSIERIISIKYKPSTKCSAGAKSRHTDEEIDSSKNNINNPSLGYISMYLLTQQECLPASLKKAKLSH